MAKVKVTIEETISQEFEVEVENIDNAYDEVRAMYKSGKLVVEDATVTETLIGIHDNDGVVQDWEEV